MKVLFVCTGNTCRSPMAEGVLRKIAEEKKISLDCDSCGLAASEGSPVSLNAKLAVEELYGIDISSHRAKNITNELVASSNYIFTMSKRHAEVLKSYFKDSTEKIKTFEPEISDPFMCDLEVYKMCAQELYSQISNFCEEIKNV